jgi:uncharacterized protein YcbX
MASIASLHLYPIKSCAGIALTEAMLGPAGLEFQGVADREWMVVEAASGQFRTQRQLPRMALITTAITDGALLLTAPGMPDLRVPLEAHQGKAPALEVRVWDHACKAFDGGDAAARWLSVFLGCAVKFARFDAAHRRLSNPEWAGTVEARNRFSDGFPLLVISQASLDDLNARLAKAGREPLPMNRFRPNIVLGDVGPYDEDRFESLTGDGVRLRPVKPCPRCPIPSIDQATGERGPDPLDILALYRGDARTGGVVFGQNVVVLEGAGRALRVGQALTEEWNF